MFFRRPGLNNQIAIASCVYIGVMLVGYTVAWTAPAIPKLQNPDSSPLPEQLTDLQMSLVGSLVYIGALLGPYTVGYTSNIWGRRPCMAFGAVVTCIAYVILARASSLLMIYIGRFLTGFGTGVVMVMALVYLGEIASTDIRGVFLTGIGIFITCGSLLAFSVGPFVTFSVAAYVCSVLAFVYGVTITWIPESPTFYALTGKEGAVKKILNDLGRTDDIEKVLTTKIENDGLRDWKELFTLKGNRKALAITIILNISQHGSGIVAVTFFATSIFEIAGSTIEPALATIILGLTQLFGSLMTTIFIERYGRQKLLSISTAICSLSMLVLGVYFYLNHIGHEVAEKLTWLPLTSLVIFYVGYDSGLGIIPNALAGEMFESNVRSKGCAVAITISWLFGFVVTTAFGTLLTVVGGHVLFWFFSGVCAMTFLYTILFVPETKGKSLREIQEMLST